MREGIKYKKVFKSIPCFVAFLFVILLNIMFCLNEVQGQSTITKIVDNGDPSTHIDLTIIGSGFSSNEINTYQDNVIQNINKLFAVNWFENNQSKFNVWRIDAISPESGVDLDDTTIYSIASSTPYDILIVLHNYDGQENVNKPYVEIYNSSHFYFVLAHELGHLIGKLDDEYCTQGTAGLCNGISKFTLNIHDKANNEKWSDLISAPPYEGARYCETGLWRPSENSIMRDSANCNYFNAVGMKAMDLGAGKILGEVESNPPSLQISGLQNNDIKSGIIDVEAITSDTSGIERVEFYWAKAGGPSSKSIKIDRTSPYNINIDTTQYENGQYYLDTLSYDKNWNYTRVTRLFEISSSTLNISIIAHEALTRDADYYIETGTRKDMPGLDRTNEPLTVGIPLSETSGITNINQLGLNGINIQQFRPLAYWSNGNIKWVLVDTQVTFPAEGQTTINLVAGEGNSGGLDLAIDNGDHILVDTGPSQFRIKKSNFNLFDSVVVNGKVLVSQNNAGGLSMVGYEDCNYALRDTIQKLNKNETYDSKNDPDSTALIEENGPARVVVKAMGAFKDALGNRLMDYTVRFHFYKNKSYVKAYVIMRHGKEEKHTNTYTKTFGGYDQKPRTFSNMQLSIPINLTGDKQFEFGAKEINASGTINNKAHMFQGYSLSHRDSGVELDAIDGTSTWYYPPMERVDDSLRGTDYIQRGLEIVNGQNVLNSLGDENKWTKGFAEIKDQSNSGLSVAMQYMSALWPASIEFTDGGNVEIGIFSKYNSKKDISIGWGTHETRVIMFDFHTTSVNNMEVIYRLEQPVVGRTSLEHYRTTKVLFGQDGLISAEDMENWFINNYGTFNKYNIPFEVWKHFNNGVSVWRVFWYSGVAGVDYPLCYSLSFFKKGAGGRYMGSLQKTIFNTDSAITRTDGFDFSQSLIQSDYKYTIINRPAYNAGGGQNHFDYAHNHWLAMPLYYYMTGNEEIKDAINDYMEEFIKLRVPDMQVPNISLRTYSRYYRTIGLGYEFTKDERLLNLLKDMTNDILDSRDNPPNLTPKGRNLERGYMSLQTVFIVPSSFILHYCPIYIQDTWQVLRVFKKYANSFPRIEELEDYLLGLAQFTYHEPFFEEPGGTDFGYVSVYKLFETNEWVDGYVKDYNTTNYMRKDDSSRAMWFAYLKTGDTKYLERGKKLLIYGGGIGSSTPYPAQDLMYIDLYGSSNIWNYIDNINVVHNGKNNYTLTWTIPEGTVAYQIKYSDKPIVDWLNFNQTTREYEYNPENYTAFFAAVNVDNEPQPTQSGTTQSFTIDIPQAINAYNTSRNLSSDNPSYITYNPNKSYYFSIKYLTNNNPPTATATADVTTGSVPLTVNFSGAKSSDQDGSVELYSWDFGDGGTSTEIDPNYTYNQSGNYTVTLTVTDNEGAKSKAEIIILVPSKDIEPPNPPKGFRILEIVIK